MTASTKTIHNHSWLSRFLVALTSGLMMFALGAATAFAGTGSQATLVAGNAAPVSTGGGVVTLNEDDDDDEDDDDEDDEDDEGRGGGGLPATDTAPFSVISTGGGVVTLNEDDDDDDDEDEDDEDDEGSGGGGLPATDAAELAASGGASAPIPALALLVITGLAGGAVTVAAKRAVRS
jgi:hypothetical protein